jgi:hypothetical protein
VLSVYVSVRFLSSCLNYDAIWHWHRAQGGRNGAERGQMAVLGRSRCIPLEFDASCAFQTRRAHVGIIRQHLVI